ncbi:MAG: OB-fold domain-containing protein [Bacillota bacterium]
MSQFPEGVPRLESYSTIRAWRERLGRYRLRGSKCRVCGALWFPSRMGMVCPQCLQLDQEDYECARTGVVVVHELEVMGYPAMGYGELAPRHICMIRLDDGVHILSEVTDAREERVGPGTRVRMVFRKHKREETGNWMYGYKFVIEGQ